jgi:hypothetical protein
MAQRIFSFAFLFCLCVSVVTGQSARFSNAFAGGLNAAHFASLDVNLDGRDDLIAYDRVAATISVFLRNEYGEYIYCADCISVLPPLKSFVQTVDINGDGRKDIATFNGISGINIYLNLSNDTLKFSKPVTLMASMYGSAGPLYCTSVDFPVFADIDGDGLVDVLNFWVPSTGDYLLYYRNTDSMHFEVADWSWGCFSEGEEDNAITLNDCAKAPVSAAMNDFELRSRSNTGAVPKHTGSTLFGVRTQQGLLDLIVGDVGYTGLYYLHNGGTTSKSHITSYDSIKTPFEFPVVSNVMLGDTIYWIVSPFTSHPFNTMGEHSILRINPLTRTVIQTDFLQNTMFDFGKLSRPCAAGGNLLVGSYDNGIVLIENAAVQTKNIELTVITENFWNLKERLNSKALSPAYNNSTQELLVGMENGRIALIKDSIIIDTFFANIQVNGFAAPTLFDLNNDGFSDLIVGEKRSGHLYYYHNENGIFNTFADTLKGVDVRDFNYSNFGYGAPAFYRSKQNELVLLCGSEQGIIYEYKQNGNNTFERTAEYNLNTGKFVAPSIMEKSDEHGAEKFIITGNIRGGLQCFNLDNLPSTSNESSTKTPQAGTPQQILKIFPNPIINGILNVLSQEKAQYQIYDLQGKIQQSGTLLQGKNTIKLHNTKSGLYLLHFRTHSTVGTVKFIIS